MEWIHPSVCQIFKKEIISLMYPWLLDNLLLTFFAVDSD